jgi:hypothetical protein
MFQIIFPMFFIFYGKYYYVVGLHKPNSLSNNNRSKCVYGKYYYIGATLTPMSNNRSNCVIISFGDGVYNFL